MIALRRAHYVQRVITTVLLLLLLLLRLQCAQCALVTPSVFCHSPLACALPTLLSGFQYF